MSDPWGRVPERYTKQLIEEEQKSRMTRRRGRPVSYLTRLHVFVCLSAMIGGRGEAKISYRQIAARSGLTIHQVRYAVQQIERDGILSIQRKKMESSVYRLAVSDIKPQVRGKVERHKSEEAVAGDEEDWLESIFPSAPIPGKVAM